MDVEDVPDPDERDVENVSYRESEDGDMPHFTQESSASASGSGSASSSLLFTKDTPFAVISKSIHKFEVLHNQLTSLASDYLKRSGSDQKNRYEVFRGSVQQALQVFHSD